MNVEDVADCSFKCNPLPKTEAACPFRVKRLFLVRKVWIGIG